MTRDIDASRSHREIYPEQYSHPLCGKSVAVADYLGRIQLNSPRGILVRVVHSDRFGLLAKLEGPHAGPTDTFYSLDRCQEQ